MRKISKTEMIVYSIAILLIYVFAANTVLADKPSEMVINKTMSAKEFLFERSITLPEDIEKGDIVYRKITIAYNHKLTKENSSDLLWISGREEFICLLFQSPLTSPKI